MLIDIHIHAYPTSFDSHVSLEEIICQAKKIGLDAVCITDHDNLDIKEHAIKISKKENFPIFIGAEVLTKEGDVLVFGVDKLPQKVLHVAELLQYVNEMGGVCIIAHPFRKNNRSLGEKVKDLLPLISGTEIFNGATPDYLNLLAYSQSEKLKTAQFGSSDAHRSEEVGRYATRFKTHFTTEKEFINAIKEGDTIPVFYKNGEFIDINIWNKK